MADSKKDELILPGSRPLSARLAELRAAGYTEFDGQGNMVNPNLDPKDPQTKKDRKRLAPKGC